MNELFRCEYNPSNFHCVHFVIRAAQILFGKDYSGCFVGLTGPLNDTLRASRATVTRNKRINRPVEGCIVLMTYQNESSHVGVFFRNRIFHLVERGPQLITLEQAKPIFKRMRFYEPYLHH